ncbi:MAG: polyprenyl synthetase family protein, partial [Nitriliruptoraceae bacterium]
SAASDLAEGKRTLLVTEALRRLGSDERREREAALGDPHLSDADVDRLRSLLEACGARDAVEHTVAEEVAAARDAIARLAIPAEARATLDELASYLGDRRA